MNLPAQFYAPFDLTYGMVTERIHEHCVTIPHPATNLWLKRLVTSFQTERSKWPENPLYAAARSPYFPYMREAARLRFRFLRLAACAYLHISYDLPRILADEWPASGSWKAGPAEAAGEDAYMKLAPIFERILVSKSHDREVVGIVASILHLVPTSAILTLNHGVMNLRRAAWSHGKRLHEQPHQRPTIEAAMLRAMTAALQHVKDSRPWSGGLLFPPDEALRMPAATSLLGVGEIAERPGLIMGILSILFGAGSLILFRLVYQRNELRSFLEEFTRRARKYVEFAVRNPNELEEYLRRSAPRRLVENSRRQPPAASEDFTNLEGGA